ncbi:MAG: TolC family protein [Sedimentisphaerales bacterium]|nr:TolC family protein [Sedimentisphaerales bacterium]
MAVLALAVMTVAACDAPRQPAPTRRDSLAPAVRQRLIHPDAFLENTPESSGPLSLDRVIAEALAASGQLEQMQRRLEAAIQQIRQAEAAFYPRLVLAQDYNITDNPVYAMMHIINQRRLDPTTNFNDPGQQQNFATQIRSEMLLLDAGGRSANRQAAQQQRRAGESERLAVQNRLVGTVTETYYRWLQARQFVRVAQLAFEQAQTNERLGLTRLDAAAALQSELMRLKTRTAESRGNLVSARIGARRLQAALERLLAREITPAEIPEPNLDPLTPAVDPPEPNRQALIERALQQRPELEAAAYLIQASRARVRAVKSDMWPRLSAFAQYQLDTEQWDRGQDSWMVGAQAGWNLFEGGLTKARLLEARARLREQESRQVELALDIALEVTQASLALTEAQEKIAVARERRGWAEQALAETRLLYQQQVVTVDALLQAQLEWNRAETAYAATVFDGRIAHALLRQGLGDFADRMAPANPSR